MSKKHMAVQAETASASEVFNLHGERGQREHVCEGCGSPLYVESQTLCGTCKQIAREVSEGRQGDMFPDCENGALDTGLFGSY